MPSLGRHQNMVYVHSYPLSFLRPTAVYKPMMGEGRDKLPPLSLTEWQKDIKRFLSHQELLTNVKLTMLRV